MTTQVPTAPYWFPGRWAGGVSMIAGPVLLFAGILIRSPYDFFFPAQLEAYSHHPNVMAAAYSCCLAGTILLWPAVAALAHQIGEERPGWALAGGTLVMLGLFARTFHAGIDHLAFQFARLHGVPAATQTMADSYGAFHIVSALNAAIFFGWTVLAFGAWRARVLGPVRALCLALMSGLMIGVLKGTKWSSIAAAAGLVTALCPQGIGLLLAPPWPTARAALGWTAVILAVAAIFFVLGQLG